MKLATLKQNQLKTASENKKPEAIGVREKEIEMAKKYRTTDLSYEELLEFRNFLISLTEEAVKDLYGYLQVTGIYKEEDLEEIKAGIIGKYNLDPKYADYKIEWITHGLHGPYKWFDTDRAVLFYDEHEVHNGRPGFGYREGEEFLPSMACVFGLISGKCCLIDRTFIGKLKGAQMEDLMAVLQEALLRRRIFAITAEDVIFSEGLVLVSEGFSYVVQTQNGRGLRHISYCKYCDEALNEDGKCVSVRCTDVN